MSDRLPVRSLAILGGGIVGLSAAIAFARALPGLSVTLIETPDDPAALADRLPGTLPSIAAFHDRIGLTEPDLLRAGTTHRIGTRFRDWGPDGAPVPLAYGDHGAPVAPGAFHQHWLNARRHGNVAPFHAFSPAAMLAAANRFVPPVDDPASPLSRFAYALRLDPPRYRDLLRALARHLGIVPLPGRFAGIERRADGGVETLHLADGRRIAADLYVDAAGPAAPLRTAIDGAWEDWSAFLPGDRLLLGTAPAGPATPTDDVTALPAGWRFGWPLRDRTLTGLAYASARTSSADAHRLLPSGTETVTLRPGARPDPWVHNVLAIGDAAVALGPLADANLHLAHAAIARAIDLLPGRDMAATERAEYNRRTRQQAARVRDYQAAFTAAGRTQPMPDSLAHTLDQYRQRGRLPYHEEESFDADSWHGLLLGAGIVPRLPDPVASATPLATVIPALARLADSTAALPARLPPYPAWLAQAGRRR